jgi:hypothetical protein
MKKNLLPIFLICALQHLKAQDYIHITPQTYRYNDQPASANLMTERIKKDAKEYAKYAPVPRIALMDYAFAANLDEYKELNGYGVLYIASLNRDTTEYPIKRVYFKKNGAVIELKKIGEIKVEIADEATTSTFGKNRVDYYYLIPYNETQINSEILIDWANNRKEFTLDTFPDGNKLDFLTDADLTPAKKALNTDLLNSFLEREYNIVLSKK